MTFPECEETPTKRIVLRTMARVYDPLGMVAPVTLVSKEIYRENCDRKLSCDEELPPDVKKRWRKWINERDHYDARSGKKTRKKLMQFIFIPLAMPVIMESQLWFMQLCIRKIDVNQGFVAKKARLAEKSLTIPRKELVAGHMSANLVRNVRKALENLPIRNVYGRLHSTVALHWIKGNGEYKQFVSIRVRKIEEIDYIQWRYVLTDENISDMGKSWSQTRSSEWRVEARSKMAV